MKLSTRYYSCSNECGSDITIKAKIKNSEKEIESNSINSLCISFELALAKFDYIFECKTIEELCGYLLKETRINVIDNEDGSLEDKSEENFTDTEQLGQNFKMIAKGLCKPEENTDKALLEFVLNLHKQVVCLENLCSLTFTLNKYDSINGLCPNEVLDDEEKISGGDEPVSCHLFSTDIEIVDFITKEKTWNSTEELCLNEDFSEEICNFIRVHNCVAI